MYLQRPGVGRRTDVRLHEHAFSLQLRQKKSSTAPVSFFCEDVLAFNTQSLF
jgi:hypothetical protein